VWLLCCQERIEEYKREIEEVQQRECTFRPVIDRHSVRMMTQRSRVLKVASQPFLASHGPLGMLSDWG
jgi:hypothetical protein